MVSIFSLSAQNATLKGTIKDKKGEPVIGANIMTSPGNQGTVTDFNGAYSLSLAAGSYKITTSYIGFTTQINNLTLAAGEAKTMDFTLEDDNVALGDVVVVGSRTAPRSSTTTPLPVDVLQVKELASTGQITFDKALQYRVPSFNTVQTPVNDATSLLDPYEIRNMGPSRTLILINGKRKNMSSLIYVQTSPGRGETGADISAIPQDAIKRVEILRDGASAQYGSDAIAGVMNIILKDRYEYGSLTLNGGVTHKGDGDNYGVSFNNGTNLGDKGFLNYTMALSHTALANRPGTVDAVADADPSLGFGADINTVKSFLSKKPDGGNINGSPQTTAAKFLVNGSIPVSANTDFYFNGAYVFKKVNSYANYRTPYWISRASAPGTALLGAEVGLTDGYVPTFEGDMKDYNATLGLKSLINGWNSDVSLTLGGNNMDFNVCNTINFGLGTQSPINFKPGGFGFDHLVSNFDLSKALSDKISVGVGTEFRTERFTVFKGDTASFVKGGANSFPGYALDRNLTNTRFNLGAYGDVSYDVTNDFLLNGTVRYEKYSDFGDAFVWKASTRYKFMDDKVTLRGSASTGFRAPTLHQLGLQLSQASFLPGGNIQIEGIVNNSSAQAKVLGVNQLKPEKSTNLTIGVGLRPTSKLSITVDYYNIEVKDRIVLSSKIGNTASGTTELDKVLNDNGIKRVSFFTNGIDTRTQGIDFVANYKGVALGKGSLNINLAGNYTIANELIGGLAGGVKNPKLIADAGFSIFDATQEALLLSSRPLYKMILGLDYTLGKWNINLNNTLFGPTTFRQDGIDANIKTVFKPAVVTDLGINYTATKSLSVGLNINNILNVIPKWNLEAITAAGEASLKDPNFVWSQTNLLTFNGRYSMVTYDGSHFSQLGTTFNAYATFRF